MCTVITLVKNGLFFGRNMYIDYDPGLKIVAMPREFPLTTKRAGELLKHYAIIGAARVEDGYPLYAEACNEKGLCMAGLNFPFNAKYADRAEKEKIAVTPYELIPYVLGKCADITEARKLFKNTEIIGIPFKESLPLAPILAECLPTIRHFRRTSKTLKDIRRFQWKTVKIRVPVSIIQLFQKEKERSACRGIFPRLRVS